MTTADQKAWEGFVKGNWCDEIDVRDFIQLNYTPYEGDASFLAGPTEKTMRVWNTLEEKYLSEERKVRILDVDTDTPADIDAFKPGYICEDDNVIVGLQTDAPLKRAMMPNGGWRMVETAIHEAGKEYNPEVKKIFTQYRKTHNDAVFDIYTPRIRAARSSHIITGLPDAYGRGRIIGDYRRVALYGVDHLIAEKQKDKDRYADQPFSEHWARYREEHSEQIKALKKLKNLAAVLRLRHLRPGHQRARGRAVDLLRLPGLREVPGRRRHVDRPPLRLLRCLLRARSEERHAG